MIKKKKEIIHCTKFFHPYKTWCGLSQSSVGRRRTIDPQRATCRRCKRVLKAVHKGR